MQFIIKQADTRFYPYYKCRLSWGSTELTESKYLAKRFDTHKEAEDEISMLKTLDGYRDTHFTIEELKTN